MRVSLNFCNPKITVDWISLSLNLKRKTNILDSYIACTTFVKRMAALNTHVSAIIISLYKLPVWFFTWRFMRHATVWTLYSHQTWSAGHFLGRRLSRFITKIATRCKIWQSWGDWRHLCQTRICRVSVLVFNAWWFATTGFTWKEYHASVDSVLYSTPVE